MNWYNIDYYEEERILSTKCTVLCYLLEYIYIVQIARIFRRVCRHKSCVQYRYIPIFCFQHAYTGSGRIFGRVCMLKANKWTDW